MYIVCPLTTTGNPAFGLTSIGVEQHFCSSSTNGSICSGPNPQLRPIASTPNPSSSATAAGIFAPVSNRPRSSNTIVTKTGSEQVSLTANTAAFISLVSLIVSMIQQSAPARTPALTISLYPSTAVSNARSPNGLSSFPVGPMSSATKAFLPDCSTA